MQEGAAFRTRHAGEFARYRKRAGRKRSPGRLTKLKSNFQIFFKSKNLKIRSSLTKKSFLFFNQFHDFFKFPLLFLLGGHRVPHQ